MRWGLPRIVAAMLLLGACAGDDSSPRETVTVFAATSLTAAFTELAETFEARHPGVAVTLNFGASSALVQQLVEGARADVFASADTANMDKAVQAGLVRTPVPFAQNRLAIVTKRDNPARVVELADLSSAGVIALCGAEVPCGAYAAEALAKADVTIAESKVTRGQNAAATLTAVAEGDAVAGIVYETDARGAGNRVAFVPIPDAYNVIATYPIAALRAATHDALARSFVAYVCGDAGQRVLARFGFLEAS